MKTKNIFFYLCCIVGLATSCSQERLEIPQKGVVDIESFYITDEDAESALTAAYYGFHTNIAAGKATNNITNPLTFLFNLPGDDINAGGKEYGSSNYQVAISDFFFDNQNEIIKDVYRTHYYAIYYCNLVTDNFQYGESTIKDRVISEARVLRAYLHMNLAIAFNDPPLVDHVLEGADKPGNYEGGHDGLLKWCAKECEESIPYLNERESPLDQAGALVVTKGFAWAVQGKALMFAKDYVAAMVPLKRVIESKKYELVPGERYWENFHIEGDGNEEKIFEVNVVRDNNVRIFSQERYVQFQVPNQWCWRMDRFKSRPTEVGAGSNGWGGLAVQEDFAAEFVANDGDSPRRKASIISFEEVITDLSYASDVKDDGTLLTREEKLKDPNRGISDPRGLFSNGYYLQYKKIMHKADLVNGNHPFNNTIIMRYAEVLLMYAECCAQTNSDVAGGLEALNAIQHRSGSGKISDALSLDVVKKEKKFEMFLEGCRFIDSVRWGDVEGMQKKGDEYPTLTDSFFDAENPTPTHIGVVTRARYNDHIEHGFKVGKHEFFPFPAIEVDANPNIRQNPGWPASSAN